MGKCFLFSQSPSSLPPLASESFMRHEKSKMRVFLIPFPLYCRIEYAKAVYSGIFQSHNAAHWFCTEVFGLRNCSTSTHHHHFNWVHFLTFLTGWIFQITYTTSTISVFRGFFSWLRLRVKCLLNPEKIRLLIPSAFLWKVNGTSLAFRTYCITYAHLV